MSATDVVLVAATLVEAAPEDEDAAERFAARVEPVLIRHLPRGASLARVAYSAETRRVYLYAPLHAAAPIPDALRSDIAATLTGLRSPDNAPLASDIQVSRLQRVFDTAGASHGQTANFHYVVETDTDTGWFDELGDWYDQEHMPGLAAVPGCIHAARYLNCDHGPRSHACYALVTADTKGSPPWLAMTHSPWSSRVRPHFANTIRTMFRVIR